EVFEPQALHFFQPVVVLFPAPEPAKSERQLLRRQILPETDVERVRSLAGYAPNLAGERIGDLAILPDTCRLDLCAGKPEFIERHRHAQLDGIVGSGADISWPRDKLRVRLSIAIGVVRNAVAIVIHQRKE